MGIPTSRGCLTSITTLTAGTSLAAVDASGSVPTIEKIHGLTITLEEFLVQLCSRGHQVRRFYMIDLTRTMMCLDQLRVLESLEEILVHDKLILKWIRSFPVRE